MSGKMAKIGGAAERYATALFELAKDAKAIDAVEADLNALLAALTENTDLGEALSSPLYEGEGKAAALAAIADKAGFNELTKNTLGVMARNGRAGLAGDLARGFAALAAAERGVSEAHVTSAAKLTQKEIDALKASLKRALGRDIEIRTDVDPAVLGGLIVQVGSRMFDSSLRTKLDGLRTAMKEA
jgi:F-type H+-transporting ATPase subunit delta